MGLKRVIFLAYYSQENPFGPFRPLLRLLLYPIRGHTVFAFYPVRPKRVFEFGAGTGNDLALFSAEGWEVRGSEPSAHACRIAAERGFTLQNLPAESANLPPESVSAIVGRVCSFTRPRICRYCCRPENTRRNVIVGAVAASVLLRCRASNGGAFPPKIPMDVKLPE